MNNQINIEKSGIYTGVGSRETPRKIRRLMERISVFLSENGWTLRSGGAEGADKAFELCATKKKIFQPDIREYNDELWRKASNIAREHHPVWHNLKEQTRMYLVRNVFQVLGKDLDNPSDFLVCWTPDGAVNKNQRSKETGGTGQTIAVADSYDVSIFNLKRKKDKKHFEKILEE